MGFKCWKENGKKEREFNKMAKICREQKESEDTVSAIHDILDEEFKKNRAYYSHTQSYEYFDSPHNKAKSKKWLENEENDIIDEGRSPLLKKFQKQLSVTQGEICEWGRMDWIEDLDTVEIIVWVKELSEKDIELLTLLSVDGLKQKQVAEMWGVSDAAISKRMKKIRENLIKILPEPLKKKYIEKSVEKVKK